MTARSFRDPRDKRYNPVNRRCITRAKSHWSFAANRYRVLSRMHRICASHMRMHSGRPYLDAIVLYVRLLGRKISPAFCLSSCVTRHARNHCAAVCLPVCSGRVVADDLQQSNESPESEPSFRRARRRSRWSQAASGILRTDTCNTYVSLNQR